MSSIIVSVGTSLLTNRNPENPRPWNGWKTGDPLPDRQAVKEWLRKADPVTATAETNTLHQLGLEAGDRLYYLHSDTPEGEFCACCLDDYYSDQGFSGMPRRIAGLSYSAVGFREDGLRSLVAEAFQIIHNSNSRAVICATGGFKAEMAYLNLVGLLTGCPVHYIHELMRELITLPALPIAWDHSLVQDNISFFEWIDAEPRPMREVEQRLKGLATEVGNLVIYQEGMGRLSAAGEALYWSHLNSSGAPPVEWPPDSGIEPAKKIKLNESHTSIPSGTREFVDWLSRIGWVTLIGFIGQVQAPGCRASVVSPDEGELKVRFGRGFGMELRVLTTARGQAQCEKVADHIETHARSFK